MVRSYIVIKTGRVEGYAVEFIRTFKLVDAKCMELKIAGSGRWGYIYPDHFLQHRGSRSCVTVWLCGLASLVNEELKKLSE